MKFNKLDLSVWKRGTLFKHYIEKLRCVMSMTVDIDVTALAAYVKNKGLKFYPVFMWIVSRAVNDFTEFKCG